MTIKEFNNEVINQGFAQTDKHIVFQTPDGKVYTNAEIISITQGNEVICKVKLNDKIEPTFKVGDVVTNISGLYPNVKCTITTVDKEKQCYYFKEVAGVTYFKDQDKLMCVKDEGVRPPVEDEDKSLMYLDVKESRAIAANAYASEVGRDTMTSIISKIKSAAAAGRLELKIVFNDYPVLNNYKNKDYLETWAKICGYKTSIYKDCMYIKWY